MKRNRLLWLASIFLGCAAGDAAHQQQDGLSVAETLTDEPGRVHVQLLDEEGVPEASLLWEADLGEVTWSVGDRAPQTTQTDAEFTVDRATEALRTVSNLAETSLPPAAAGLRCSSTVVCDWVWGLGNCCAYISVSCDSGVQCGL